MHGAREHGYVTTMNGRRRNLPELNGPDGGARAQAERIAINTPLQGTAADLIKLAMVRLAESLTTLRLDARMILQVHDELLLEVSGKAITDCAIAVRRAMGEVATPQAPLKGGLEAGAPLGGLVPP